METPSPSTATPAATPAAAATPTGAPTVSALSLNEYLVLTLAMSADMGHASADLSERLANVLDNPDELQQALLEFIEGVGGTVGEGLESLSDVTPPPEADAYHADLMTTFRDFQRIFEEFGAALESGDDSRAGDAMLALLEVAQDLLPVAQEGQRLAMTALEADADDPLNSYLMSATEVQFELTAALDKFFEELVQVGSDMDAVFALSDELIVTLEDFEDRWLDLSPPPEARELHQRQADLIAEQIVVNRSLFTAIREGDGAAQLEAQQRQMEIGAQSSRWGADWNELLIEALSR